MCLNSSKIKLYGLNWFVKGSFFSWSSFIFGMNVYCICFLKFIISNSFPSMIFSKASLVAEEDMMFATSLFLGTVPKLLLDVLFIISCSFDVLGTLFRYIIIQVHCLFNLKMFRINSVILGWLETFFMNTSLSQSFLDFSSFGMPLWIIRTLPYTSGCSTTFNYFCAFFICWWHYYWTTWRWLNSIFTEANFVVFLYIRIIILQIVLKETVYEFFNFKINHNIPHLHFAKTLYSCFRRL